MASPVKLYQQEMHSNLGFFATWLPASILELGDFGVLEAGRFRKMGSLKELGIPHAELINIDSQVQNKVVGYVSVVGLKVVEYGQARTGTDAPSRKMASDVPINIASVTKTLTAIAVLQSLAKHNKTIDESAGREKRWCLRWALCSTSRAFRLSISGSLARA